MSIETAPTQVVADDGKPRHYQYNKCLNAVVADWRIRKFGQLPYQGLVKQCLNNVAIGDKIIR